MDRMNPVLEVNGVHKVPVRPRPCPCPASPPPAFFVFVIFKSSIQGFRYRYHAASGTSRCTVPSVVTGLPADCPPKTTSSLPVHAAAKFFRAVGLPVPLT